MNQDHDTETNPAAPGPEAEEAAGGYSDPGLFGKLPRSRPGTRSPRRPAGEATAAEPARAPEPEPSPPDEHRIEAGPAAPGRAAEEAAGNDSVAEQPAGGIEELAWAGIAVTAEAATLGVRLLSRAINAARRAADRD